MYKTLRRIALGFAAAAASAGLTLASVAPANATILTAGNGKVVQSCYGVLTKYNGSLAGGKFTYKVFYNSANGGSNCVKVYNHTGKVRYMDASIWDGRGNKAYDMKAYKQYAGGSTIYKTKGKCVSIYVRGDYNGKPYSKTFSKVLCN